MAFVLTHPHQHDPATLRRMIDEVAASFDAQLRLSFRWDEERLHFTRDGLDGVLEIQPETLRIEVETGPALPVTEAWLQGQFEAFLAMYL